MSTTNGSTPPKTQVGVGSKLGGNQPLSHFSDDLELPPGFTEREGGSEDPSYKAAVEWLATEKVPGQNFWPGLCLAYVWMADSALKHARQESEPDPFTAFEIEQRTSAGRAVNTLNFIVDGEIFRSRPAYNRAAQVIRVKMRREHPSAAPHATQSWRDYQRLIELIFAMSPPGRTRFAEHVWREGVLGAYEHAWRTRDAVRVVRPFERVLSSFDTSNSTRGGALFQSLVFGYFCADSPNLTLESHNVNTGSSRANMPGDVAGFRGGELELAVEVKDQAITLSTVEEILVDFLEDLADAPNATAVVVASEVDEESRHRLATSNVIALSREDLRRQVMTWDLPKQQDALRGSLYFLERIQKNSALTARLKLYLEGEKIAAGIIDAPVSRSLDLPVDS